MFLEAHQLKKNTKEFYATVKIENTTHALKSCQQNL